jgi:hypothetical protein
VGFRESSRAPSILFPGLRVTIAFKLASVQETLTSIKAV